MQSISVLFIKLLQLIFIHTLKAIYSFFLSYYYIIANAHHAYLKTEKQKHRRACIESNKIVFGKVCEGSKKLRGD